VNFLPGENDLLWEKALPFCKPRVMDALSNYISIAERFISLTRAEDYPRAAAAAKELNKAKQWRQSAKVKRNLEEEEKAYAKRMAVIAKRDSNLDVYVDVPSLKGFEE